MFIVAQISDFHVSTPDSRMETELRTTRRLELAVEHLNSLDPRPDVVLATGDLVDRGTAAEYAEVRALLGRLTMPCYAIPGNHDRRDTMRQAFAEDGYLNGADGFLHYSIEDYPLRLVALDTVIPGKTGGTLCEERLAWLDSTLAGAPDRPTLVFMHHPPLHTGISKMDEEGFDATADLARVLRDHPQVEAVVAGHIHRKISGRLARSAVCTCPSTSHQIGLELGDEQRLRIVLEPPACLLHVWFGPDHGLASHLSYVGDGFPGSVVFDGKNWTDDKMPPLPAM